MPPRKSKVIVETDSAKPTVEPEIVVVTHPAPPQVTPVLPTQSGELLPSGNLIIRH